MTEKRAYAVPKKASQKERIETAKWLAYVAREAEARAERLDPQRRHDYENDGLLFALEKIRPAAVGGLRVEALNRPSLKALIGKLLEGK